MLNLVKLLMGYEDAAEKGVTSGGSVPPPKMTLQKAVDMGEYSPEYLSTFAEWHTLSPHMQLNYIKQGLDNRRVQLLAEWAELDRAIDYRLKPELKMAQENIWKQIEKIEVDRERLYYEYSNKF